MADKHLYAVDLTDNKKNEYIDDNPFITGRLSDSTRQANDAQSSELSKMLTKKLKMGHLTVGGILILLGAMILVSFFNALTEIGLEQAMQNGWWLTVAGAILLAAGIIVLLLRRKAVKEQAEVWEEDEELNATTQKIGSLSDRIQFELGLPEDEEMVEVDILPYRYKRGANKEKEVLEDGVYRNTLLFAHRTEDALLLTDYDTVMTIPLSAFKGYHRVDKSYKIFMWLRDEEPNEGRYKAFGIKEESGLNYRVKTYYRVMIESPASGECYELRVPCYDFEVLCGLVELPCLDAEGHS